MVNNINGYAILFGALKKKKWKFGLDLVTIKTTLSRVNAAN
jgi:hypothetical protein